MIAPAVGYTLTHNATFVLPNSKGCQWMDWLGDLFQSINSTVPLLHYSLMKKWPVIGETGFTQYNPIPDRKDNFTIAGFRQTWKYFNGEKSKELLRNFFKFTEKYEIFATVTVEQHKSKLKATIAIGIHMRIGDLLQPDRQKYGYQMATSLYYLNVMELVVKRLVVNVTDIAFLVATDSPMQAKQILLNLNATYNIVWLEGTAFEDFAVLSKCDHSIMSGGTFGLWASWLAKGNTFYYNNFSVPNSDFGRGFISSNFYPSDWISVGG